MSLTTMDRGSWIYLMIILFASCNAGNHDYECSFTGKLEDYDEYLVSVITGDDNMKNEKLSDLKVLDGNKVKVQCKNAGATIGNTGLRDQEVSCDTHNTLEMKLEACHEPCDLSSVVGGTVFSNNRIKNKDDPKATGVPVGDKPVIYCENDKYRIFEGLSEENTDLLKCVYSEPFVPVTFKAPGGIIGTSTGFTTKLRLRDPTGSGDDSLDVKFQYTLSTEIVAVTVTSACGPAVNEKKVGSAKVKEMSLIQFWDHTFTLVDNGAGNGMTLQYNVASDAPINAEVNLDDDCRTKLHGEIAELKTDVYVQGVKSTADLSIVNPGRGSHFHKKISPGSYEAFAGGNIQLVDKYTCIPVPEFTKDQKTATAPNTMTLSIELDADRDDDLVISLIEVEGVKHGDTDSDVLCKIVNPAKPANVFTCDYKETNLANLQYGITDIKATMDFGSPLVLSPVTSDVNILPKAYAGPPAVTDAMVTEFSATGTRKVTVKWDVTESDKIFKNMATDDYVIMFGVSVVKASHQIADFGSYDYNMIKQKNAYDFSLETSLEPLTTYSLQIMTFLEGHSDGGKWIKDFETGRRKPTLQSASKSDTEVTVTVTLAETSVNSMLAVEYTVTDSISGVVKKTEKKVYTFANSVVTFDVINLEKGVSYEIDLLVYVSDSTTPKSETVNAFLATSGCSALPPTWANLMPLTKVLAKDEKILVECKPGFMNKGDSEVQCVKDANFDALLDLPDCTPCEFPEYIDGGHRISKHSDSYGVEYATYECYMPFIMNPNKALMTYAVEEMGLDVTVAYKKMYNSGQCMKSQLCLPACVDHVSDGHCGLPTEIDNGHVDEFMMSEDGKDKVNNAELPRWAKYECEDGSTMHDTIKGNVGWCRKDGSMELPSCEKNDDYVKIKFKLQNGNVKKLQRVDGKVFAGVVLAMRVDKDNNPYSDSGSVSEWEYTCNDGTNNYAAGAVCRSLGFGSGIQIPASKKMMAAKHKFGWTHVSCKYDDTLMTSDHCHAMRYDEALTEYGIKEATCFHKFDIAAVKCFDKKWKMETEVKLYRKKMACLTQFVKEDTLMNLKDMGTPQVKFMLDGVEIETVGDAKYKRKGFFAKVNLVEKEYDCASCEVYVGNTLLDSAKWCKAN